MYSNIKTLQTQLITILHLLLTIIIFNNKN